MVFHVLSGSTERKCVTISSSVWGITTPCWSVTLSKRRQRYMRSVTASSTRAAARPSTCGESLPSPETFDQNFGWKWYKWFLKLKPLRIQIWLHFLALKYFWKYLWEIYLSVVIVSCCWVWAFCRFIPDDVTFDDEPKDRATDVDYGSYKPKLFTSMGATTAKVCHTEHDTKSERLNSMYGNVCLLCLLSVIRLTWRGMKRITTGSRLSAGSSIRMSCWTWTSRLTWPLLVRKKRRRKRQRNRQKVSDD